MPEGSKEPVKEILIPIADADEELPFDHDSAGFARARWVFPTAFDLEIEEGLESVSHSVDGGDLDGDQERFLADYRSFT